MRRLAAIGVKVQVSDTTGVEKRFVAGYQNNSLRNQQRG